MKDILKDKIEWAIRDIKTKQKEAIKWFNTDLEKARMSHLEFLIMEKGYHDNANFQHGYLSACAYIIHSLKTIKESD